MSGKVQTAVPSFFSLLQQGQSQLFASPPCDLSFFVSPFFIGQESPLQQSQLSQHEAVSLPDASFFFIGQESPLQQQHAAALVAVEVVREYAKAAIEKAKNASIDIARISFLFIFTSLFRNRINAAG
jgi:hypothetical protein